MKVIKLIEMFTNTFVHMQAKASKLTSLKLFVPSSENKESYTESKSLVPINHFFFVEKFFMKQEICTILASGELVVTKINK